MKRGLTDEIRWRHETDVGSTDLYWSLPRPLTKTDENRTVFCLKTVENSLVLVKTDELEH